MRRNEYSAVCEAARAGETRQIENRKLRYTGKVLECTGEDFVVDAFGHRFRWSLEDCRESRGRHPLGPPSNR